MSRKYRSVILNLSSPNDARFYDEIKQDAVVDQTGRYEVVSESAHWDQKTGERQVHIDYIEDDAAGSEDRF